MITEFYETNLTWNDRISSIIGKNHSKIDSIILERSPKLSFNSDGKINIERIKKSGTRVKINLKIENK